MNIPCLVVFIWMVFSLCLLPQDFIPSSVMLLESGGSIEGIGDLNREKLMQYHVDAIKKNGISKEIHKKNGKVVSNYYYSPDGLLTKSDHYNPEYKAWSFTSFLYNEKKLLVKSVMSGKDTGVELEYLRDSLGRIEGVNSKECVNKTLGDTDSVRCWELQIRYVYNNHILEKAGPYEKQPKEPIYEGGGWTFSFDPYGRGISGGEGDGGWYVTFNKSGKLATIVGEFYGMASLYTIIGTITYKNDLMNRITEVETTKITDWNGAKISKEKPSYKKTITSISYEYGYKTKK